MIVFFFSVSLLPLLCSLFFFFTRNGFALFLLAPLLQRLHIEKTFFALNVRLAITGLLLFFGGPYFIANLPNRFKIMNPGIIASGFLFCKFLYFGNILSKCLATLALFPLTVSQRMRHPLADIFLILKIFFRM